LGLGPKRDHPGLTHLVEGSMSRVAKLTGFRGWVSSSTAKTRAFLGWFGAGSVSTGGIVPALYAKCYLVEATAPCVLSVCENSCRLVVATGPAVLKE